MIRNINTYYLVARDFIDRSHVKVSNPKSIQLSLFFSLGTSTWEVAVSFGVFTSMSDVFTGKFFFIGRKSAFRDMAIFTPLKERADVLSLLRVIVCFDLVSRRMELALLG